MLDTHTDTRMKKTHAVASNIYNPAGKKVIIVQGKIRNGMFVTGTREKERQGEVGRWLLSLGHQKMLYVFNPHDRPAEADILIHSLLMRKCKEMK